MKPAFIAVVLLQNLLGQASPSNSSLAEAELLLAQKKFPAAAQAAQSLVKREPKNARAFLVLGKSRFYIEQDQPAIEALTKAIELDSKLAEAHFFRGLVSMYGRKNQAAQKDLERATELEPQNAKYWHELGKFFERARQDEPALKALRRALDVDPKGAKAASAHFAVGTILHGKKRYPEALVAWEAALKLDPRYINAHYNLGQHHQLRGDPTIALKHFQAVHKLKPDDVGALEKILQTLHQLGRHEETKAYRKRLLALPEARRRKSFCFAQFDVPNGRFFALESVSKEGTIVHWYEFKFVQEGKVKKSINLEFSKIAEELKAAPYLLGQTDAQGHSTFNVSFRSVPPFPQMKEIVLKAHAGGIKVNSSSAKGTIKLHTP